MHYYGDLQFVTGDHLPRCSVMLERSMAYYALNFAHSGSLRWITEAGRTHELHGPVAFWTWPGPTYRYGCGPGEHWDHYYLTFRGPRADRMHRAGLLPAGPQPWQALADGVAFARDFARLLAMVVGAAPPPRAAHLLEDLLLRIHEQATAPVKAKPDAIDQIVVAIRSDP